VAEQVQEVDHGDPGIACVAGVDDLLVGGKGAPPVALLGQRVGQVVRGCL
jgi:hypothetical protein